MKLAECHLESISPYSQSRYYSEAEVPKLEKELAPAYEMRTWRNRCHVDSTGHIIIPPMALTNAVKDAAKYLSIPIPGKSRQTFTKHFEAGVLGEKPITLPETRGNVKGELLFVPSDGRRGGGRRVEKMFPLIPAWKGVISFYLLDDIITEDVFKTVLETAGQLIGIGRFRPRNLGYYGRFKVNKLLWVDK